MKAVPHVTLLTGLPRSGTTLTCALLNEFPDTVALAEPIIFKSHNSHRAVSEVDDFIIQARQQALSANVAISRHVGGFVPDNWVPLPGASPELRRSMHTHGPIRLNKPLSHTFHL